MNVIGQPHTVATLLPCREAPVPTVRLDGPHGQSDQCQQTKSSLLIVGIQIPNCPPNSLVTILTMLTILTMQQWLLLYCTCFTKTVEWIQQQFIGFTMMTQL